MKKTFVSVATAALLGMGALALTAGTASAYVVCNSAGECWHTDHKYHYDNQVGVQYHPDDWYFHRNWANDHDHHWRDYHEGRGYYRDGVWVSF